MPKKNASYLIQELGKDSPRLIAAFRNLDDRIKFLETKIGFTGLLEGKLKINEISFSSGADLNDLGLLSARTQRCKLGHSVAQSIDTATDTILAWDTIVFDTDLMHDIVIDNKKIIFRTSGIYLVGTNILWAVNAVGDRRLQMFFNSGVHSTTTSPAAALQTGLNNVNLLTADKDEFVEVRVFQDSGGPLNVTQSGSRNPTFWAVRVG